MDGEDHRLIPMDVGTRRARLRAPLRVPPTTEVDPSDDELLCYLDGLMSRSERELFERRLKDSPHAAARVEILLAALRECGWKAPDEPDA
jgi:hypothetical protein